MKYLIIVLSLLLLVGCVTTPSEKETIKSDLVGQTTGGREKTWKFQSTNQIKEFEIDEVVYDKNEKIYFVYMILHDDRVESSYDVDVKITYEKGKVKHVGLLRIDQIN